MNTLNLNLRAALLSLLMLMLFISAWHLSTSAPSVGASSAGMTAEEIEYAKLLGKDPQPGHMDDFVQTYEDNGGVHINSGIPNHAFYQVAINIGGFAWERAGRIWYDALRDSRLRPNSGFLRFARITHDIAGQLMA